VRAADQFDIAPGYLNTASIGVPPRDAVEALQQATAEWAAGRVHGRRSRGL
jgi:kynureninase